MTLINFFIKHFPVRIISSVIFLSLLFTTSILFVSKEFRLENSKQAEFTAVIEKEKFREETIRDYVSTSQASSFKWEVIEKGELIGILKEELRDVNLDSKLFDFDLVKIHMVLDAGLSETEITLAQDLFKKIVNTDQLALGRAQPKRDGVGSIESTLLKNLFLATLLIASLIIIFLRSKWFDESFISLRHMGMRRQLNLLYFGEIILSIAISVFSSWALLGFIQFEKVLLLIFVFFVIAVIPRFRPIYSYV